MKLEASRSSTAPALRRRLTVLAAVPLAATALAATLLLAGCPRPAPPPPEDGAPSLLLVITVDQLGAETLERFRPLLTGGLSRLASESVSFAEAHHRHAMTATGPGHATLATGRYPSGHGIVGNSWYDRREGGWAYCASLDGRPSPGRLEALTLADWLRRVSPASRIYSASGKDRSAILTAGWGADGAYWFDRDDGVFVGAAAYPEEEPEWLEAFNDRRPADAFFGTLWEPLPETVAGARELGLRPLPLGEFDDSFPHALGGLTLEPGESLYEGIYDSPFADRLLVDLALELIVAEELGQGPRLDLLALSFSAVDVVGHGYGPDSPELLDTVLRLDRGLAELLELLDRQVGLDRVLISLSADHGVLPLPEVRGEGRRIADGDIACYQRAGAAVAEHFDNDDLFLVSGYLDHGEIERAGLDRREVEQEARRQLERCPAVARVWTAGELAALQAAGGDPDPAAQPFVAGYYPARSPDLTVQLEEGVLRYRGTGTTHGTAYRHDSHVPWLLRVPGVAAASLDRPVATADVAPTLADLLGMPAAGPLDGVSRRDLLPAAAERLPRAVPEAR